MRDLTREEEEANKETRRHIECVGQLLAEVVSELESRASVHDKSKMELPEVEVFAKYTPLLASTTYGSEEYKRYLQEMKTGALGHHYANNRHHPEYFDNGINGMDLVDLVEMFCDWKAATLRHNDGDIGKSLMLNKSRFSISDQLTQVFKNTVRNFGWK